MTMKKPLFLMIVLAITVLTNLKAQSSALITTETIESNILGMSVNYSIYLPPSYEITDTLYPVLYLLHGYYGNHLDWPNHGLQSVADYQMDQGDKEMIIVSPNGMDAFYCNNYDSRSLLYENFMVQEFIPAIEELYRVDTSNGMRAIAGLSMGGYGATYHGFKYPDMYSSSFNMSGAVLLNGREPSVETIVNTLTSEELDKLPAYWIEIGTSDFLYSNNLSWHNRLNELEVEHNYVERAGEHNWTFWTACLPKAIHFASQNFPHGGNYYTTTKDLSALDSRIVYPNPANGIVTIKTGLAKSIRLHSVSGKILCQMSVDGPEIYLHVELLPRGLYFVEFVYDDKNEVVKIILR